MKEINFEFSLIENDYVNTYSITSKDLTKLKEKLKKVGTETNIERKFVGMGYVAENYLKKSIASSVDEILYLNINMNSTPLQAFARVKNYPKLYHIIFNNEKQCYFKDLSLYLKNQYGLSDEEEYSKMIRETTIKLYPHKQEKLMQANYDSQIPEKTKIELINSFMKSLQYDCIKSKPIEMVKKEIDFILSRDYSKLQQQVLLKLKTQLYTVQQNTKIVEELKKNLYAKKNDSKIYKK